MPSDELLQDLVTLLNALIGPYDAGLPGDLHIGQARPRFQITDILDAVALICKLRLAADAVTKKIRDILNGVAPGLLGEYLAPAAPAPKLLQGIVEALNSFLYTANPKDLLPQLDLDSATLSNLSRYPPRWYNRMLIQLYFPNELMQLGEWGVSFSESAAPPAVAAPWQIYRSASPVDGITVNELRAEIAGPGKQGDPARYGFAIGAFNRADQRFVPCLSVTAGCRVMLSGTVRVQGQVLERPIDVDPNDPRFGDLLAQQIANGLAMNIDTTSLQLKIMPAAGTLPEYTISLKNVGSQPISGVTIYETLRVGSAIKQSNLRIPAADLAPGEQSQPILRPLGDPSGDVQAIITVTGLAAPSRPVFVGGSETVWPV